MPVVPGEPASTEPADRAGAGARPRRRRRMRRDRRGRGLRAPLAAPGVPLHRTRSEIFDDLVLDAVEDLEQLWDVQLSDVDFAVEVVPHDGERAGEFDPDVLDDAGIALGRLYREGLGDSTRPIVLIYRRPVELRAPAGELRAELVFTVVGELVADLLGRDLEDLG